MLFHAGLVLAVALRLAAVLSIEIEQVSDFAWYLDRGREIAAGQGYGLGGVPTAYWPVGYPAFLGGLFLLFGPDQLVAQLANVALALGILLAVRALTLRMGLSRAAAHAAVLLLALYPNHIAYCALTSAELLFSFLLLLGCLLLFRGGSLAYLAAGVVFGCAVLTKPQMLPLPAALLLLAHLGRPLPWGRLLAAGLLVYTTLAATLLPWQARNQELFGRFVFVSSNGGINLLVGANPAATGGWMKPAVTYDSAAREPTPQAEVLRDLQARSQALTWIRDNPAAFLAGLPAKLGAQLGRDGEAEWSLREGIRDLDDGRRVLRALRILNQVYYWLLLAAAAAGLALLQRRVDGPPAIAWSGLVVAGYLTALALAFFGAPRFHFPMMPFIAIYAGLTASGLPILAAWAAGHRAQPLGERSQ